VGAVPASNAAARGDAQQVVGDVGRVAIASRFLASQSTVDRVIEIRALFETINSQR